MSRRNGIAGNVLVLLAGIVLGWALAVASNGRRSALHAVRDYTLSSASSPSPFSQPSLPAVRTQTAACGFAGPPRMHIAEADEGNAMWKYVQQHIKGPRVDKWESYFDVYERYFSRFRGHAISMLEVGVQSGGSIGMWQDYFGVGLIYHGVDINGYCEGLFADPPRVNIHIADQANRTFWREMRGSGQRFDVVLDDGGHLMDQQIVTFEEVWEMLNEGGVYICEDMGTSFDHLLFDGKPHSAASWGGGFGKPDTFAEYAKNLTDSTNGNYIDASKHPDWKGAVYSKEMLSMAFYDQMVVIEKGAHPPTPRIIRGNFGIDYNDAHEAVKPAQLAEYRKALAAALQ
jgi:hypothetical protein